MKITALSLIAIIVVLLFSSFGCQTVNAPSATFPTGSSTLKVYVYTSFGIQAAADIYLTASNGVIANATTSVWGASHYATFSDIADGAYTISCQGNTLGVSYDPYWKNVPLTVSGNTTFTLDSTNANM